jgi:hypothetical protein
MDLSAGRSSNSWEWKARGLEIGPRLTGGAKATTFQHDELFAADVQLLGRRIDEAGLADRINAPPKYAFLSRWVTVARQNPDRSYRRALKITVPAFATS